MRTNLSARNPGGSSEDQDMRLWTIIVAALIVMGCVRSYYTVEHAEAGDWARFHREVGADGDARSGWVMIYPQRIPFEHAFSFEGKTHQEPLALVRALVERHGWSSGGEGNGQIVLPDGTVVTVYEGGLAELTYPLADEGESLSLTFGGDTGKWRPVRAREEFRSLVIEMSGSEKAADYTAGSFQSYK